MRSRLYSLWPAVVAVMAACALGILGLPAAAFAQSPALSLNPTSGPPGTQVTVTGEGWTGPDWASGVPIDLSKVLNPGAEEPLADGIANPRPDGNGGFMDVKVSIPSTVTSGTVLNFSVLAAEGGHSAADAYFTVTGGQSSGGDNAVPCPAGQITVNPPKGIAHDTLTISGKNWAPGGSVAIAVPYGSPGIFNTNAANVAVGADGSWQVSATVDDRTPRGDYIFIASEPVPQCSGGTLEKNVTFRVDNPPANGCSTPISGLSWRTEFTDACNQHDECYMDNGGPGKGVDAKNTCDNAFLQAMDATCLMQPEAKQADCLGWAEIYHTAVQQTPAIPWHYWSSDDRATRAGPAPLI